MEAFTKQLQASAFKAVTVAEQAILATTKHGLSSLDEMAAVDEYVQSEGYNNNNHNNTKKKKTKNTNTMMTMNHRLEEATTSSMSTGTTPIITTHSALQLPSQQPPIQPRCTTTIPLRRTMEQPHQKHITHEPSHIHNDRCENDENDDDDHTMTTGPNDTTTTTTTTSAQSRRPNRFMDDLESRLSQQQEQPSQLQIPLDRIPASAAATEPAVSISVWFSNTASSILKSQTTNVGTQIAPTSSSMAMTNSMVGAAAPPLSRSHPVPLERYKNNDTTVATVPVVSSTSCIQFDPLELEQLRLLEESHNHHHSISSSNSNYCYNFQSSILYSYDFCINSSAIPQVYTMCSSSSCCCGSNSSSSNSGVHPTRHRRDTRFILFSILLVVLGGSMIYLFVTMILKVQRTPI